jgi:hypothetical protein
MNTDSNSSTSVKSTTDATSELNNLLEIISGTSAAIENIWDGAKESQKYFDMLRTSIDRAARVTAQLVVHAGGTDKKVLFHPGSPRIQSERIRNQQHHRRLLRNGTQFLQLMTSRWLWSFLERFSRIQASMSQQLSQALTVSISFAKTRLGTTWFYSTSACPLWMAKKRLGAYARSVRTLLSFLVPDSSPKIDSIG